MKGIFVVLALVIYAAGLSVLDQEWEQFKIKFKKEYSGNEEEDRHYKTFLENKAKIAEHNKKFENGELTFTLGINHLADLLPEETAYLRGYKHSPISMDNATIYKPEEGVSAPEAIDWREKGYVTPVKDQGKCGSCWAFSATGSLEGRNFARTGKLVSLSEQNLVDCVIGCGCDGGFIRAAYWYVMINSGIDTEESYPYTAQDEDCHYNVSNRGGICHGFISLTTSSETDLQAIVGKVGPVSAVIDASFMSFHLYSGGVYYEPLCSSDDLNHCVLIVGYGTQNGTDYWLVKNSWGTSWGEDGYIQMARNKNNNCGIASKPSFPV